MQGEIRIRYHYDPEGAWWADSPDLERWTAAGETFEDVRREAYKGVEQFAGRTVMIVEEGIPESAPASGHDRAIFVTMTGALGAFSAGASGQVVVGAGIIEIGGKNVVGPVDAGAVRREGDFADPQTVTA